MRCTVFFSTIFCNKSFEIITFRFGLINMMVLMTMVVWLRKAFYSFRNLLRYLSEINVWLVFLLLESYSLIFFTINTAKLEKLIHWWLSSIFLFQINFLYWSLFCVVVKIVFCNNAWLYLSDKVLDCNLVLHFCRIWKSFKVHNSILW